MKTIIQNRFNGGLANNPRDTRAYIHNSARNFDFFAEDNCISPYRDLIDDNTGAMTSSDVRVADIITAPISGGQYLIGLARESSVSEKARIITKATTDSVWTSAVVATSNNRKINTLVNFKEKAYFIDDSLTLFRFDPPSTLASVGSFATTWTGDIAKPFVHPEDKLLYVGIKNLIFRYDGTTFSSSPVLTLPDNAVITSLTSFGGYLAIAVRYAGGTQNSQVMLWGRNSALATLQEIVDFGAGDLMMIENVDGIIIAAKQFSSAVGGIINQQITVYGYAGGSVEKIHTINTAGSLSLFKTKKGDSVVFPILGTDTSVRVGKVAGQIKASEDIGLNNGASVSSIYGFTLINDYLFVTPDDGILKRTNNSASFTNQSIFDTPINYGMDIGDRTKNKQLMAFSVATAPLSSGQSVEAQYRVNGGAWKSILTVSTIGAVSMEASNTATGAPFESGVEYEFRFISTGGAKITEYKYKYDTLASLF